MMGFMEGGVARAPHQHNVELVDCHWISGESKE